MSKANQCDFQNNSLSQEKSLDTNIRKLLSIAIDKASQLERLNRDHARVLFKYADLSLLGHLANLRRQKANPGNVVTYLIDRNINYTNVCNTDCSFCAFYRHDPQHAESYVLSKEVLAQKISEALANGATRILLQGGHNDQLPFQYYLDLVSWIHDNFPIEINSFSPSEIEQMVKISGKSAEEVLRELKAVGMAGLPGGGAEILDDEIRQRVSPKKIKADQWIEMMRVAHSIGLTTTASMVIGFGETIEHRLNHLQRLRDLQDQSNQKGLLGFGAFISWTLQHNQNTSMGRSKNSSRYGASALEYLRNVAVCRMFLDNVRHHQSSWPTLGLEIAEIGLHFGCDDIGSTMMEENVVSQAGAPSKDCWTMTADQLREAIIDAGFEPAQRNSSFNLVQNSAEASTPISA